MNDAGNRLLVYPSVIITTDIGKVQVFNPMNVKTKTTSEVQRLFFKNAEKTSSVVHNMCDEDYNVEMIDPRSNFRKNGTSVGSLKN